MSGPAETSRLTLVEDRSADDAAVARWSLSPGARRDEQLSATGAAVPETFASCGSCGACSCGYVERPTA